MPEARKAPASKPDGNLKPELPPDQRVLTRRQAEYLAETAELELRQLEGRRLGELDQLLKFRIDPTLLFFRKVCGRVVRRDPTFPAAFGARGFGRSTRAKPSVGVCRRSTSGSRRRQTEHGRTDLLDQIPLARRLPAGSPDSGA